MSATVHVAPQREVIPGYTVVERLGAGGYGEVWKVEVAGGLHKALKIIYGFQSEDRAVRELKALHHIKEVRHPFLLSLERIEVIDGRLMIVTELADASLTDRYQQCRQAGLPGIPRAELIGYLRDAADALDYMLETHSLQHLDVKPENLLLVGGRAKVADFGLVKEIADKTRSLVGAMTPSYASPEVFDGRATRQSDQYSLAVVYQELLTGVLPFPGKTAAQLAAQHTRSRPQLAALPPPDREIIGRALSKRADQRYGRCRDLIDALAQASNGTSSVSAERTLPQPPAGAAHAAHTELLDGAAAVTDGVVVEPPAAEDDLVFINEAAISDAPTVRVSTTTVDLPLDAPPTTFCGPAPAMFVGVGGTGTLAVAALQRRLLRRFGGEVVSATFPTLVVETDASTLKRACDAGLDRAQTVQLQLRQSHQYRADADQLLPWLGRRWLYNVPKNGLPSGMRPWGRLALVDHAGQVVAKLRQRVIALGNAVTATRAESTLSVEDAQTTDSVRPWIFLVGSCCGGTGGGMLLELAYALQNILSRSAGPVPRIAALVVKATNQCSTTRQLAAANTLALLTELQHYARCGALGEGRADARTAIFEGADFPLDDVYFVDMGEELTSQDYYDRVERLADYLYCRVASPLGGIVEGLRHEQPENEMHLDLKLRSVRLERFEGFDAELWPALCGFLATRAHRRAEQFLLAAQEKDAREPQASGNRKAMPSPVEVARAELIARLQAQNTAAAAANLDHVLHCLPAAVADNPAQRILQRVAALEQQLEQYLSTQLDPATPLPRGEKAKDVGRLQQGLVHLVDRCARELLVELLPAAMLMDNDRLEVAPAAVRDYIERRQRDGFPYGSQRRTIVLAPGGWTGGSAGLHLQTLPGPEDDRHVYVCEELEDISLAQVAAGISAGEEQVREAAGHLHARVDVEWSPLAQPVLV